MPGSTEKPSDSPPRAAPDAAVSVACLVCGTALPDTATAIDVPFVRAKPRLCPVHTADAIRAAGAVAKLAGDMGAGPQTIGRLLDGARGLEQVIKAVRGK